MCIYYTYIHNIMEIWSKPTPDFLDAPFFRDIMIFLAFGVHTLFLCCPTFSGYRNFSEFPGTRKFPGCVFFIQISYFFGISGCSRFFRMCIFFRILQFFRISGYPQFLLDVPFFPDIMVLSGYHDFSELPPCENLGYPPWPPVGGYPPLATSWGLPPWPPVGRCCNPCWVFYPVLINCYMMLVVFVKWFGLVFT